MKPTTQDEYHKKVNLAIDYISSHLQQSINLTSLAQEVCISPYHFHRIMSAHLGEPLGNYITRQRLERSAGYLQHNKELSLQELAEKVGYETPQSLSKAFKKHFGISPIAFRKIHNSEFIIRRKENTFQRLELHPEIKEIEEIKLVYIRIFGEYGEADSYSKAWSKLGKYVKDKHLSDKDTRWVGLSFDDPNITKHTNCRFYACATVKEEIEPHAEFGYITIPQGKFAVYTHKSGTQSLQNLYNNIYHNLQFKLRDTMSFEEYMYENGIRKVENIITKVYIPIE